MAVANVCYHMSISVANEKTWYHLLPLLTRISSPVITCQIHELGRCWSHTSPLLLYTCVRPFGTFLLRCILGQTQTQIPDVIPCYFIVKCSGFVIHHINLSHVYGSATAEACPTSTRRVTKQSGFSLVNHFLTCCCDGCCQIQVQVSFMKLVALSNYRIKDKSLLNI